MERVQGADGVGLLIEGQWHDQWYDTKKNHGSFVREQSQFKNWITTDGQPGSTGIGGFTAQSGRYHLYVSYACPWAHRTLIFRTLKNLENHISIDVVHPFMMDNGWEFDSTKPEFSDSLFHSRYLFELYQNHYPIVPVALRYLFYGIKNKMSSLIMNLLKLFVC